ncbi:MAG: protein-disulfide reductase DsbD domain-containing protein [Parvibaculaceae bacterium]
MTRATFSNTGGKAGRIRPRYFLAALFALCTFVSPLRAAEEPENGAGEEVTLIGQDVTGSLVSIFGVRMKMKPGWHTYWRKPGDSGLAPTFDWSGSKNIGNVIVSWPAPRRFDAEGDTTFGYEDEVIWPVLVYSPDPAKPLTLDLKMSYGICKDICVPNTVHLTKTPSVAQSGAKQSANADLGAIMKYLARVPQAPQPPVTVAAKLTGRELTVILSNVSDDPVFIPETTKGFWFGKPVISRRGASVIYKVPVEIEKGHELKGNTVTMVFAGEKTVIEAPVKIQ